MKNCVSCGFPKEDDESNWKYKALGIRQKSCRECQHKHQAKFYQTHQEEEKERTQRRRIRVREEAREYVWNYKASHPCEDCGEADPVVLDFHHVRGKGANIGVLIQGGASLERIKAEIRLCVVLCSNCHRKRTAAERRKWW
jgi:hypothetical protein